jgi:trans-4-hydroxy-L-proline dehydratase
LDDRLRRLRAAPPDALNRTPKYGNDDDYADDLMQAVFEAYFEAVDGRRTPRAALPRQPAADHGPRLLRAVCGATPDGRKAGLPLSEGISPVQGADRQGPTAA